MWLFWNVDTCELIFTVFVLYMFFVFQYERQHEKDAMIDLTEELDKEWKDVSYLIAKGLKVKVKELAVLFSQRKENQYSETSSYNL